MLNDNVVQCSFCVQSLERDLQSRVQEVTELQQQLQSSEREKQTIRQQLMAELTRAEETIRREQQQRQQVTVMFATCSAYCD